MNNKKLRNDLIKLAKAHPGQVREALLPLIKAYDDCCDGVPKEEQCDECDDDKEASLKTARLARFIWKDVKKRLTDMVDLIEDLEVAHWKWPKGDVFVEDPEREAGVVKRDHKAMERAWGFLSQEFKLALRKDKDKGDNG
jgi:hypothetical protein